MALHTYEFKIQALVGAVTDIGAQKLLGEYSGVTGTKSVHATIKASPTLDGVVQFASVESASQEQIYDLPSGAVIGREWVIEVLADAATGINTMREALAAILDAIPNTQVNAYTLGSSTTPCLQVVSGEIPYEATMG